MMSLKQWLSEGKLKAHKTSKEEIQKLFEVADRDINDAETGTVSPDWRFTIAYNAVLALATIPLYAKGYKTDPKTGGHHYITIESLIETMGLDKKHVRYFQTCRSKRHSSTYDNTSNILESQVEELIDEAEDFRAEVEEWLNKNYLELL